MPQGYNNFSVFYVGYFCSPATTVGFFLIKKVADIVTTMIIILINSWLPKYYQQNSEVKEFDPWIVFMSIFALVSATFSILISAEFIYDIDYDICVAVLMGLSTALIPINRIFGAGNLLKKNKAGVYAKINMEVALFFTLLTILLVYLLDEIGAALSIFLARFALTFMYYKNK